MANNNNEYLILRHEDVKYHKLIPHLAFRRKLVTGNFAESKTPVPELREHRTDFVTVLTLIVQKILFLVSGPLRWLGRAIEFFINFLDVNGGIFGIPWRIITVSLVFPNREKAYFRSIIGHIDGRYDLHNHGPFTFTHFHPLDHLPGLNVCPLNLAITAAKLSYENAAHIREVVTDQLKMHYVRYYSNWNKYLKHRATQAFIFTDKPEDATVIVLAFRGTEPFNALDWITDVDLSWVKMGKLGKVHLGFMRALGLQNEKDGANGFPREYTESEEGKALAYYAIRETLKNLVQQHSNAKIIITGHSLGGALAILYPAILALHDEQTILNSIHGVVTFGQPRVGDATFGKYMKSVLGSKYIRVVFRYDLVPRVPFDRPPVAQFKHFGTCVYFQNWNEGMVVDESPNPNYFDPLYLVPMHAHALDDLLRALFLGLARVKDFEEGYVSLLFRACGLLIPGIASHSPRDYANGGKMARIKHKIMDMVM